MSLWKAQAVCSSTSAAEGAAADAARARSLSRDSKSRRRQRRDASPCAKASARAASVSCRVPCRFCRPAARSISPGNTFWSLQGSCSGQASLRMERAGDKSNRPHPPRVISLPVPRVQNNKAVKMLLGVLSSSTTTTTTATRGVKTGKMSQKRSWMWVLRRGGPAARGACESHWSHRRRSVTNEPPLLTRWVCSCCCSVANKGAAHLSARGGAHAGPPHRGHTARA